VSVAEVFESMAYGPAPRLQTQPCSGSRITSRLACSSMANGSSHLAASALM
jgi:hypothetical protein